MINIPVVDDLIKLEPIGEIGIDEVTLSKMTDTLQHSYKISGCKLICGFKLSLAFNVSTNKIVAIKIIPDINPAALGVKNETN